MKWGENRVEVKWALWLVQHAPKYKTHMEVQATPNFANAVGYSSTHSWIQAQKEREVR